MLRVNLKHRIHKIMGSVNKPQGQSKSSSDHRLIRKNMDWEPNSFYNHNFYTVDIENKIQISSSRKMI
jgi:hypothetical protein